MTPLPPRRQGGRPPRQPLQIEVAEAWEVKEDIPEKQIHKGGMFYRFTDGKIMYFKYFPDAVIEAIPRANLREITGSAQAGETSAMMDAIERYNLKRGN
jgi:hypothetical protein